MADAGLFATERVELLDGTIVTMVPHTTHHAGTITRVQRALARALGDSVCFRVQLPIVLDDWSEPEPDVTVCKLDPLDYTRAHPRPMDVLLVCEVAVSSLGYDRLKKARAYAGSNIQRYWIIDVDHRAVHVFGDPDVATRRYRREQRLDGDAVVHAPDGTALPISDLLPPS